MTNRQEEVLRLIVDIFTTNKTPVGSKTLKDHGIEASTATIRNDMVALEEMGLLEKTHTSSGRVPSYNGYRYYVNNLLQQRRTSSKSIDKSSFFSNDFKSLNDIMNEAVNSLAHLTNLTTFSLGLEKNERKLTGFRFLPLNERQIVTIVVTDKGTVESKIISKPQNVSPEEIRTISSIINDKLVGQSLLMVYHKLRTEIPMILQKYFQEPGTIIDFINSVLAHIFEDHVYVAGETNLLDYGSISNVEEFKKMYEILNNNDNEIIELLELGDQEIRVQIGTDINNQFLSDLSLVSGIYEVQGHGKGIIAVLGPTNMPYSKVVELVENYQMMLKLQLEHYYFELDSMKFDYSN